VLFRRPSTDCLRPSFGLPTPRPLSPTLLPYTTLFRSQSSGREHHDDRLSQLSTTDGERGRGGGGDAPGLRRASRFRAGVAPGTRSEEHTSELQSRVDLVCRLLLEKKKATNTTESPSPA